MHIARLHLLAHDLEAQRRFYAETLGFAVVADSATTLTIATGDSQLHLIDARAAGNAAHAPAHYAFNIPYDQVLVAKGWLGARTPLLADRAGRNDFHNEAFASHQIYFRDPDGNIGELIGRARLPASAGEPFTAATAVRGLSEIGLAVSDVPTAARSYLEAFGPSRYGAEPGADFAAVGDDDGMLIVVRAGRIWFPDTGIPADPLWLEAELRANGRTFRLAGPPYRVLSIP